MKISRRGLLRKFFTIVSDTYERGDRRFTDLSGGDKIDLVVNYVSGSGFVLDRDDTDGPTYMVNPNNLHGISLDQFKCYYDNEIYITFIDKSLDCPLRLRGVYSFYSDFVEIIYDELIIMLEKTHV